MGTQSKNPKFPSKAEFRRSILQIVRENAIKSNSSDTVSTAMLKHALRAALDEFCQVCPGSEPSLLEQVLSSLSEKHFVAQVLHHLFDETPSVGQLRDLASDIVHYANEQIVLSYIVKPILI